LGGDHVGGERAPELGDLHVLLLEDHLAVLVGDRRGAELPLDLVGGIDPLLGEVPLDLEPPNVPGPRCLLAVLPNRSRRSHPLFLVVRAMADMETEGRAGVKGRGTRCCGQLPVIPQNIVVSRRFHPPGTRSGRERRLFPLPSPMGLVFESTVRHPLIHSLCLDWILPTPHFLLSGEGQTCSCGLFVGCRGSSCCASPVRPNRRRSGTPIPRSSPSRRIRR